MATESRDPSIIRTKLYRPPVAADFVARETLLRHLELGFHLPFTLVSAPAGFGKSSLISHWLAGRGGQSAWLNLDETLDNLSRFLSYLLAGIQMILPDACGETRSVLKSAELPSPEELAGNICNELDRSDSRFILVLDDYYLIQKQEIHTFLEAFLQHPPRSLHLVVITRWDPPLSISRMRAKQLMNEVRLQDLQFSEAQSLTFFERALDRPIDPAAAKHLFKKTEGWPVANRLAAVALRNCTDVDEFISSFGEDSQQLQDYLMTEILSQQPEDARKCLVRTSIFERFCASLCGEACEMRCGQSACVFHQDQADQPFQNLGLLVIPLDNQGRWFRFHHLFGDLLRQRLVSSMDAGTVAELHRRGAIWFEREGLLEEALRHLLKTGDPDEAAQLIVRMKDQILNEEWWTRLEQWFEWVPAAAIERTHELLLLKAYLLQNRCRYLESFELFSRIDAQLAEESDAARREHSEASLCNLRCLEGYIQGNSRQARTSAEKALCALPSNCYFERGQASIVLALTLQMVGESERARQLIYQEMGQGAEKKSTTYHSRLLAALGFVDWIAGDLRSVKRLGKEMMETGDRLSFPESSAVGRYFIGIADYQLNELSSVKSILLPVVASPSVSNLEFHAQSVFALAAVHEAEGESEKANELVESFAGKMLRAGNMTVLLLAQSFEAELAWRQGKIVQALKWARTATLPPLAPMYRFHSPHITQAKILSSDPSGQSQRLAEVLLDQLEQYLNQTHNQRFLAEVLAWRALSAYRRGEFEEARSALLRALEVARPGRLVRVFVDLGQEFTSLLNTLTSEERAARFIQQVAAACANRRQRESDRPLPAGGSLSDSKLLLDSLTNRELDILHLLAGRLSNKEIADRLGISPATVKRHAENLYSKLGVNGRREAVAMAEELGVLTP